MLDFAPVRDVSELWKDFSNTTELEETAAEVEILLRKCDSESEIVCEKSFKLRGDSYSLFFVPGRLFRQNHISVLPMNAFDEIRTIFGVNSSFFLVSSPRGVPSDSVNDIFAVCATALAFLRWDIPFLVQTHSPGVPAFIGRRNMENGQIMYQSRVETKCISEFSSFESIINTFKHTWNLQMDEISASARIIFSLEESLCLCYEWGQQRLSEFENWNLDCQNAPRFRCFLDTNFEPGESAVSRALRCIEEQLGAWCDPRAAYEEPVFALYAEPRASKLSVAIAPRDSVLSVLARKLVEPNFGALWHNFIRWLRKCVDDRRIISSISFPEDARSDSHILYQKLQMLNFGISKMKTGTKTSSYFLTSDLVEQIQTIIGKQIEMSDDVRDLLKRVLDFKAANHGSPITEFKYFSKRVDAETVEIVWNAVSPSLFDYVQQCERAMDYLESLYIEEYIPVLCYVLICDTFEGLGAFEPAERCLADFDWSASFDAKMHKFKDIAFDIERLHANFEGRLGVLERFPAFETLSDTLELDGAQATPAVRSALTKHTMNSEPVCTQVILTAEKETPTATITQRLFVSNSRNDRSWNTVVASTTSEYFK